MSAKVAPEPQMVAVIEDPVADAQRTKYLIDPSSDMMKRWDLASIALLGIIMIITPYEVAFMQTSLNALFFLNRMADIFFILDMVKEFFLMYRDDTTGRMIKDHNTIIRRYMGCWFWLDTAAILPFDLIGVIMDSEEINKFKALRIIRLFRLFKLLRLLRAGRIFDRWETAYAINNGQLTLVKFLFLTVIVAHWMACAFHMVRVIEDDQTGRNWVEAFLGVGNYYTGFEIYICAYYWAVMTMSTIGYGDLVPKTTLERIFVIGAMFLGSSIFAYVVGSVTSTVASMGARTTEFRELMDAVNSYMESVNLPYDLRVRIRSYFRHKFNVGSLHSSADLLDLLSPALRESVIKCTHSQWIKGICFFRDCSDNFVVSIALALQQHTCSPHELMIALEDPMTVMYIVKSGVCACKGSICTQGMVVGEDMIVACIKKNTESRRFYTARALSFTEYNALQKTALESLLERNEKAFKQVQRLALHFVFRDTIVAYNNAVQNLMTGSNKASQNARLVGRFQSKLARLFPDGEVALEEQAEEEDPFAFLDEEGRAITTELRSMTSALEHMQEKVLELEKRVEQKEKERAAGSLQNRFNESALLARISEMEMQVGALMAK